MGIQRPVDRPADEIHDLLDVADDLGLSSNKYEQGRYAAVVEVLGRIEHLRRDIKATEDRHVQGRVYGPGGKERA